MIEVVLLGTGTPMVNAARFVADARRGGYMGPITVASDLLRI